MACSFVKESAGEETLLVACACGRPKCTVDPQRPYGRVDGGAVASRACQEVYDRARQLLSPPVPQQPQPA